ncbi:Tellurium resistance [Phaeacidiphilus oryzae]|jgi:tellurite resistance protein TerA|uniref:Tellurium resistance n=1 Tax=Phaeacidiphilus oryzae TaxID=348818 RepID=UPI000563E45A|nr:Tellurium resistance [Phaeacidiphilus oryzae]
MAGVRDFLRRSERQYDTGVNRVTLTKSQPVVELGEQATLSGTLQVNLHWTMREADLTPRRQRGGGLFNGGGLFRPIEVQSASKPMVNVDLDLACMYELTDGTKGVVQPLGGYFGELQHPPFIKLSGDDRYGAPSGETMYVNMDQKEAFRRLLIFVYIYDETPAFARTHGVVTFFPYAGPRIEIRLDERDSHARSCAVALLERKGERITVRREVRYVYGYQAELDRLYGWGLQWKRGYKGGSGPEVNG